MHAGCGGGEEGGGRGDVAWQGRGDQAEVATVGAVSCVVPGGGVAAARRPRDAGRKRREEARNRRQ